MIRRPLLGFEISSRSFPDTQNISTSEVEVKKISQKVSTAFGLA
jgi:hypothetical protein